MPDKSKLRRTISKWANNTDMHARDMRATHVGEGDVSIAEADDRAMVTVCGSVRSLTMRPRGGVPALEAVLFDGSGVITIVWLGRRRIAGIDPGRSMRVRGRIGVHDGVRIIYNPRYELMS